MRQHSVTALFLKPFNQAVSNRCLRVYNHDFHIRCSFLLCCLLHRRFRPEYRDPKVPLLIKLPGRPSQIKTPTGSP